MLVEANPNADKVIVEGAAHMVNMERPEEFNRLVMEFLEGLRIE
jgi:pimeloyl-ACP methyl ester carboxylesterase